MYLSFIIQFGNVNINYKIYSLVDRWRHDDDMPVRIMMFNCRCVGISCINIDNARAITNEGYRVGSPGCICSRTGAKITAGAADKDLQDAGLRW